MTIARIALPVALEKISTIGFPDGPSIARGAIVRVRLARRSLIGVVVDVVTEVGRIARARCGPAIDEIVALPPLSDDVMTLVEFVADYYQQPFGMAVALAGPAAGKRDTTARAAIAALRLTAQGRASLPARLIRAPAAQRLFAQLDAAETRTDRRMTSMRCRPICGKRCGAGKRTATSHPRCCIRRRRWRNSMTSSSPPSTRSMVRPGRSRRYCCRA